MAGWGDEYESACALADAEARKLHEKDPSHELLKYWFAQPEDLEDGKIDPEKEKANRLAMKNRFWDRSEPWQEQPGLIVSTIVVTNYYIALKRINGGNSLLVPEPGPPPPKALDTQEDCSVPF